MTAVLRSLLKLPSTGKLYGVGRLAIWLVVLVLGAALVSIPLCFKEPLMSHEVAVTVPELQATTLPTEPAVGLCEPNTQRRQSPAETAFIGFGLLDFTAHPKIRPIPDFDKVDVETDVNPGGGAVNIAEAYQLAGGGHSRLGVITGADAPGNMLVRMLNSRLSNVRRIATAVRTRISLLTPRDDRGDETRIWTERSAIDEAATFAHIQTWLAPERRIVLASMTADQAGFVEQVLDAHAGETVMMLTRGQCDDRERTIALAARCAVVQLNASELATWTGIENDVVAGINWLRERGVESVIVTAGLRGTIAYLRSAGGWQPHVSAFSVPKTKSTNKCGDFVLGTFLAGLDRGESSKESLRISAAAAAMNAAGLQRAGGWQELVEFADKTPTLPFVRTAAARTSRVVKQFTGAARRLAAPAGYMTAGAALVIAMIWFSILPL